MKVVLITGHDAESDRKTGFHFWADIMAKRGIDVDFITAGSSPVSLLKKGGKQLKKPFNRWVSIAPHIQKYTWMPFIHPLNLNNKILDVIAWPLFSLYPALLPDDIKRSVKNADLFIVESGAGVTLVPRLAKLAPKAKFIFNFSDRFQVVKFHPIILQGVQKALPYFSLIRLNATACRRDFPEGAPTRYIPQGLDKDLFDRAHPNPYKNPRNAVSVGDMLFDANVIQTLARTFPDWTFHMFGKGAKIENPEPNIVEYGELPFDDLVPYLQHADIGLAPYAGSADAEYLSESSLKLVQYTYCRLPIVAPGFAAIGRDHVLSYDQAGPDDSVIAAFQTAITYDRAGIDRSGVLSWDDVVQQFLDAPMKKTVTA